jgi:DNA-directed RNA polymerase specialized sigma24 family protein
VTELDLLWSRACTSDSRAFGDWAARVEGSVRRRLASYARLVDTEAVMQEALLRMWARATDHEAPALTGENASLRFAIVLAWNLARNLARREAKHVSLPPEEFPEGEIEPDPLPDPYLRRAIEECLQRLAPNPKRALLARIASAVVPDATVATELAMTLNTFFQNITRARKQLADCLAARGITRTGAST